MNRPIPHIIDTKAKKIFENIVPDIWVYREKSDDYGIDYEIEIFNEDGNSTGDIFYVQLKGSEQKIENDTFKKDMEIRNLKYYDSLKLPTLLVYVSVETKQIWAIWIKHILEAQEIKDGQKTLSIPLSGRNLIGKNEFRSFSNIFNETSSYYLNFQTKNKDQELLITYLSKWIERFYTNISITNRYLPTCLTINLNKKTLEYKSIFKSQIDVNIDIDNPIWYRPSLNTQEINNEEALYLLIMHLAKFDIKGSLKLITEILEKIDNNLFQLEDLFKLIDFSIRENSLIELQKLADKVIKLEMYNHFSVLDLIDMLVNRNSSQYRAYRIEDIIKSGSLEDKKLVGTYSYNLANIYMNDGKFNQAIHYYFKAKKLEPSYLEREYWWKEVAGVMFLKKHYKFSENFYKKSLELNQNDQEKQKELYPLIADTLFFQGKFKEAHNYFQEYFKKQDSQHISSEWILKNMSSIELEADFFKIEDRKLSLKLSGIKNIKSTDKVENQLTKAIKLNPINGLAWFNLGSTQNKAQKYDNALFSYLMTALLQDWDKEALINSLFLAWNIEKLELFVLIIRFMFEKYDDSILNDISDFIINQEQGIKYKVDMSKSILELIRLINKSNLTEEDLQDFKRTLT